MRPHKRLDIWEEVMRLTEDIYDVTASFPKEEMYGLVSQMKRSVVSVVSNIAEGCARKWNREKVQFFTIARGSLSELDAQLEISLRLKFLREDKYKKITDRCDKVSRMLQGLIKSRELAILPNNLIT